MQALRMLLTVRNGRAASPQERLPCAPLLTVLPPRCIPHCSRSAPPPFQKGGLKGSGNPKGSFLKGAVRAADRGLSLHPADDIPCLRRCVCCPQLQWPQFTAIQPNFLFSIANSKDRLRADFETVEKDLGEIGQCP